MELRLFSAKSYDRDSFDAVNVAAGHDLSYVDARLTPDTAVLAPTGGAVCAFVNDDLGADVLAILGERGVRGVALRCAGYNHVDLAVAARHAHPGRPGTGVLAECGRGTHPGADPGAQPQDPEGVQPCARRQLRAGGPPRLRPRPARPQG